MGQVGILFRLMPDDVGVDLQRMATEVRQAVPAGVTVRGTQVKDVAYGLQALLVSAVMNDEGGILDSVEQALAKVPHVETVEVMEEGLL